MPLPIQVDQAGLDALPETVRGEYQPLPGKEGTFQLSLDPGETGLTLANVTTLQETMVKERDARKALEKKYKPLGDLDVTKALEAVQFKQSFDNGELDDEASERLAQREKQLAEKYEDQRKQLVEKHASELGAKDEREKHLFGELYNARVVSSVRAAIAAHGGAKRMKAIEPFVTTRVKLVEEDGKFTEQVIGDNGSALLSRKPGSTTEYMSVDEFVEGLSESEDFAPLFEGSGSSGAGSGSSDSSTGKLQTMGGELRITEAQAKDVATYREARAQAQKQGKRLVIVK